MGSWRVSDSGLLNLSGLDQCLTAMFHDEGIIIDGEIPTLPALYTNDAFPCLPIILPRYSNPSVNKRRINTRLTSVRQNIEHVFGLHYNILKIIRHP